jgi:hypothetical protein
VDQLVEVNEEVVGWVDWLVDLDLVVGLGWHGSVFSMPHTHSKSNIFDHSQENSCVADCDI